MNFPVSLFFSYFVEITTYSLLHYFLNACTFFLFPKNITEKKLFWQTSHWSETVLWYGRLQNLIYNLTCSTFPLPSWWRIHPIPRQRILERAFRNKINSDAYMEFVRLVWQHFQGIEYLSIFESMVRQNQRCRGSSICHGKPQGYIRKARLEWIMDKLPFCRTV